MNKFRHVSTCSDMFENHMNCKNSNHIESEKFRHVSTCSDMFENHMNCNNSDLENLKNLDNWVLWTFWELTCGFRSILSSDLGLDSFESCSHWTVHFWTTYQPHLVHAGSYWMTPIRFSKSNLTITAQNTALVSLLSSKRPNEALCDRHIQVMAFIKDVFKTCMGR